MDLGSVHYSAVIELAYSIPDTLYAINLDRV